MSAIPAAVVAPVFTYSKYQTAVFDWLDHGTGHAVVNAVAGSGKSTTLKHAVRRLPATSRILMVAFNKHIADALQSELPANVTACTLNSYGNKALNANRGRGGRIFVDADKTAALLKEALGLTIKPPSGPPQTVVDPKTADGRRQWSAYYAIVGATGKIVGLLKGHAIDTDAPGAPEFSESLVLEYAEKFNLELPHDGTGPDFQQWLQTLASVWERSKSTTSYIDFDDQLYLPILQGLPLVTYNMVMVDEAQDLNPVQIELVRRIAGKKGRVVLVGDRQQACYGFRGADPEAIDNAMKGFRAAGADVTELPLSICYRCPSSVIARAAEIVPHIEAASGAPAGTVRDIPHDKYADLLDDGDYVLCRLTAPLVSECLKLIRKGRKAIVKGRDIGKNLADLLDKAIKTTQDSPTNPVPAINAYRDQRMVKLAAAHRDNEMTALEDQCATLLALHESLEDDLGSRNDGIITIDDIKAKIATIFSDDTIQGIIFCTIHRAKGLEAKHVAILRPDLLPFQFKNQKPWQSKQEMNLKYIAITRAMDTLTFVTPAPKL